MNTERPRGFVLYTQDYFGDRAVRLMPPELRLVWVEAFFLMDQSPRRGVLLKKNGAPYAAAELATLMNCPVELIAEAWEWIVREGIADQNAEGTLVNRRMVREEKKRKINQKNGKKGGNPSLVLPTKETVRAASVNPPVKPRARVPDPEPDPEPELEPDPESTRPVQDSLNTVPPPAEKRGGHHDLTAEHFQARCMELTGAPYEFQRADFVRLASLRKAFQIQTTESPPSWPESVTNYFASPLSKWTIADLCARYAVFKNSALDEYNKPIAHVGRNRHETKGELLVRRQREEQERLHQVLHRPTSDNVGGTDPGRAGTDVRPRLVGPD